MFKGEYREKFVSHPSSRPVLNFQRERDMGKMFTLGDDGTVSRGEYKDKFVQHSSVITRPPQARRHREHLKSEGQMDTKTESKMQFVEKTAERPSIAKGT